MSVVVCGWDEGRFDDLRAAVDSVTRQTLPAREVVVVVDHNPALAERLRRGLGDRARVLESAGEPGLSGARNSGVDAARGDVVAFLDDDAVAAPDWLEQMTRAYSDPRVIGVGGWVEPVWPAGRPPWLPAEFDWVVGCSYRGLPAGGAEIRNPIGANMSFRREAFDGGRQFRTGVGRVGARPVGCEETEFSIRALQALPGTLLRLERGAVVRHRVTAQRASFRYFASRCYAEGLSKALVAGHVGSDDALASERSYTRRDLPRALAEGLRAVIVDREMAGAARAAAVVAGLALAAAGYGVGLLAQRRARAEGAPA